ncbi:MFS transporter [Massilia violaceinigra]|uniref:MFS transporter n=1 Tax=Massilia violaceinigra TaxID=2045208 RepID=A0ABY3ZZP1_9BURK|nr:MFS transporter [Massilia violaceinigra]UOD27901.1 MFS transporter [Massilia violaceinigra]
MPDTGAQQRLSTRLAFLAAGLAMSVWAPLVPLAKLRLGMGEAQLGLLLLCLGAGSLLAMPSTSFMTARFGVRPVVLCSGLIVCLVLPGLAFAPTPVLLGCVLFTFGAAIGTLDVAMNIQAVVVEKNSGGSLMSGFHGLFSLGGALGAGSMALLLWLGLNATASTAVMAVLVAAVLAGASSGLLREPEARERNAPIFVVPHGAVILIGGLCFLCFLAEGAILDWSALLLTEGRAAAAGAEGGAGKGGLGYAAFAIAMTLGRLTGDKVVGKLGGQKVLLLGGLCAAGGFFCTVLSSSVPGMLAGFVLIGLGASNIVPVLFTAAGSQKAMPVSLAIGAITTIGYAGILAGPAAIGFVAHATSLPMAFAGLGCAMLLIAASARLGASSAPR